MSRHRFVRGVFIAIVALAAPQVNALDMGELLIKSTQSKAVNDGVQIPLPKSLQKTGSVLDKIVRDLGKMIVKETPEGPGRVMARGRKAALSDTSAPAVNKATQETVQANVPTQFAGQGEKSGLVDRRDATLDEFISHKAKEALFLLQGEQEKAMCANPLQAAGSLTKRVFSTVKF